MTDNRAGTITVNLFFQKIFVMPALINRILLFALFSLFILPALRAQSFIWTQAINASGSTYGTAMSAGATDSIGNFYSTGVFGGTANFAGVSLTAVSDLDMFIMKQDPAGNTIWVKQVEGLSGGVYGCFGNAVDVDDYGNVYITGTFRDSFDFNPGPAVYKLNSFGGYHAFILKLDPAGNFVWVRDIGTEIPAVGIQATAAKLDKKGNLHFAALVSGNGTTPIDVDPGPGLYNITPLISDLLLEKLDADGNFIWAKLITGDKAKTPYSLDFDSASNVFVSGAFAGTADFDPGPGIYTLTATPSTLLPNQPDCFVAKYDSSGNFAWAHSFGGTGTDRVWSGAVDRSGNVLVTGGFEGAVDFDPGPGAFNLTAASSRSIFTLKLRNNGDFAWAKMAGSAGGLHSGRALATDDSGNVYTAAVSPGGCDVDPGPGEYLVDGDCIVQKLDSNGNFVWGAGWQGDIPGWIGLDNENNVYITGVFSGVKDFDPGPDVYWLSGVGGSVNSGFILKLNQTLLPNSIEEAGLQTSISVYPNPSSGIVTFSAPVTIKRIEVTDVTGKVVYRAEPAIEKVAIDLGSNAAGVYFYEVDGGFGKRKGKLVVY